MQACQGRRQALVIAGETTEAADPGEGALDDPELGQQHEAALGAIGLRQPNHGQLDRLAGRRLQDVGQLRDLYPVLLVGRTHDQGDQMAPRAAASVTGSLVVHSASMERLAQWKPPDMVGCGGK